MNDLSGPALKQLHAHRAIHDGALSEGIQLTDLLVQLLKENRIEHSRVVATALIEHWETRTLAHAEAEEEGFYNDMAQQKPELSETVIMLRRDHDLIRLLVAEVKSSLAHEELSEAIMDRFKTIAQIVRIHSEHEEKYLLDTDHELSDAAH
ncbi:MAG TPA: hemerythrin domain-containing protein [Paenibacillus sp.]|uniref:hemerythrin domain-containing protein n=1 Tax=Paenibacillus sp. TaxID=58172 RepID=UPI0028D0A93F|nr:hemerythrin domain-containing protein [Paenibacillus sp.]HUC91749.1 hemerythrin domain-containing protein [Paenibacillus sp.]